MTFDRSLASIEFWRGEWKRERKSHDESRRTLAAAQERLARTEVALKKIRDHLGYDTGTTAEDMRKIAEEALRG